jgi:hypothetical protein
MLLSRTFVVLVMACWQKNVLGLMLDLKTFPHSGIPKINEFLQYLQNQKRVHPAKVGRVPHPLVLPASSV